MKPEAPTRYFAMPFCQEGDYTIPQTYPDETTEGRTTLSKGFPEETQLPVNKGGVAPNRWDFNGMYYMLSTFAFWAQSGGLMTWNSTLSYVPPAMVYYNGIFYVCVKENGPETDHAESVRPTEDTEGEYWQSLFSFLTSSENLHMVGQGNTITLTDDATGSGAFDSDGNVSIPTTVETASQLRTGRGITLQGDTTGTVTFDGSQDVSMTTTTNTATALRTGRNISLAGDATGNLDNNFDGTANRTLTATVNTATALRTTRYFSITGDVTASQVGFTGTGNVELKATLNSSALPASMTPDWANASKSIVKGETFTAPCNGYAVIYFYWNNDYWSKVTITSGSKSFSYDYGGSGAWIEGTATFPLAAGDKILASNNVADTSTWVPCK